MAQSNGNESALATSLARIPTDLDYSLDRYLHEKTGDPASFRLLARQESAIDHGLWILENPQSLRTQQPECNGLLAHIGAWTLGENRYVHS